MSKIYYSKGLITDDGSLLNAPTALANGVLLCNSDGSSSISTIDSILGYTPANDALTVHLAGTETITGAKTFTDDATVGASSPGSEKTLQLYGNLNIQQNAGQAGDLFHIVDALATDLFAITSSGGLYGSHIQDLGTSDSPTFDGLNVGGVTLTDSSGVTAFGYTAGSGTADQSSFGYYAGRLNSGASQSAFGFQAGELNTGTNQSAFGYYAGRDNIGRNQSAFGYYAGRNNTGTNQSALGYYAGFQNTGASQSAFGVQAGGGSNTGDNQSAFGFYAGYQNSGVHQSAFGYYAGRENSGVSQAAFGTYAGRQNTGTNQSVFGYYAGHQNSGASQAAFGSYAGRENTAINQSAFGYYAGRENTGIHQSAFGTYAGYLNTGDNCVFIGYQAGQNNTTANRFELAQKTVNATPLIAGDFSSGQVLVNSSSSLHANSKLSINGAEKETLTVGHLSLSRYASFGYDNKLSVWSPASANSIFYIEGTNVSGFQFNKPVGINSTTDKTTLLLSATASQTANLTEWQDSSGTVLAYVDSIGALNTDKIADINGQLIVESDDIYFQIPGNTRGPRMTVNTSGNTLTWSGSKAGSSAFHKIEAGGGQSSQYPILRVTGLGSSVSNQIQQWVRSSDSTLQAYVTSDGLFQGNTGFTAGDGTSSDSGGLQMATTGGNHAVDVQGNIQYVESYNKTIIRRGSDAVFDSNGAGGVIATAVATLPRGVYVTPASASLQAMVVRAKASQTENIVEIQDSAGGQYITVNHEGVLQLGDAISGGNDPRLTIRGSGTGTRGRTELLMQNDSNSSAARIGLLNSHGKSFNLQCSGPSYATGEQGLFGTSGGLDMFFTTDGHTPSGGTSKIFFRVGGYNIDPHVVFTPDKKVGIGDNISSPSSMLQVNNLNAVDVGFKLRAAASQTANIVEFQDSAGVITNQWDSAGSFTTPSNMVIQGTRRSTETMLSLVKSTGHNIFKFMATGAGSSEIQGDAVLGIETDSTTGRLTLGQLNGRTVILINSTDGVGIGYGVGTSPEGTLEVQDQLGLETTLVNITAGPTQTTNLTQWRDNSDNILASMSADRDFRLYNTWDGTNDEYLSINWTDVANVCTIGTNATGTGSIRNLKVRSANDVLLETGNSSDSIYFKTDSDYRIRMSNSRFQPYINDMRLGATTSPWHGNAYRSGVANPTTSDLDDGYETTWKNTVTGYTNHWINDGATMKSGLVLLAPGTHTATNLPAAVTSIDYSTATQGDMIDFILTILSQRGLIQ